MENKAKFKFNGGLGALLCSDCNAIIKTGTEFSDDDWKAMRGEMEMSAQYCDKCGGTPEFKYKLVRERDGLTKYGNKVLWLEWNKDGTFSEKHDTIEKRRSLILDFSVITYTWMTTTVDEILENREDYIKFKTKNSIYELFIKN